MGIRERDSCREAAGRKIMDNKKIGDYISILRKNKNLTQKDLADLLGITDKAVSKWERGAGYPDISMLKPLADILGTSVNELLEGEAYLENSKESGNTLKQALDYANKLVISKEHKLGNIIAVILSCSLILAICTSFIVNVSVSHELSWSIIVLDGCLFAAFLLLPLLLIRKNGLLFSLCFLTLLILPFLGIIEYIISGKVSSDGWLWGIGFPVSVTWLVVLWIMYLIYKKTHLGIWLFSAIGLLLCVPGQFITNYVVDVFTHFSGDQVDRSINYTVNTFSLLAAAGICLIISIYRRKSKNRL
jgi:transcriptional regulator with XRE-family HTH domain